MSGKVRGDAGEQGSDSQGGVIYSHKLVHTDSEAREAEERGKAMARGRRAIAGEAVYERVQRQVINAL